MRKIDFSIGCRTEVTMTPVAARRTPIEDFLFRCGKAAARCFKSFPLLQRRPVLARAN